MSRTLSTELTNATSRDVTRPIYLIQMGWDAASPTPTYLKVATWAADITWDGSTWAASGAACERLSLNGGQLILPNGDDDPWLALVQSEVPRGRTITVYEHHTDQEASPKVSDAEQIFSGVMDEAVISIDSIHISLIEDQSNKVFPPTVIGPPTYNYLLQIGSRLFWGPDIVTVT